MTAVGQCLCGAIGFEIDGSLGEVRYCHCLRCRQGNGTAFSTNAKIPIEKFRITSGDNNLTSYEMADGVFRHFCTTCGSPIYVEIVSETDVVRPRIGALIGNIDVNISANVWVGSKALWFDVDETLKCYDEAAAE